MTVTQTLEDVMLLAGFLEKYRPEAPGEFLRRRTTLEQRRTLSTLKSDDLQNVRPDCVWLGIGKAHKPVTTSVFRLRDESGH
jgi:hypothetical protein